MVTKAQSVIRIRASETVEVAKHRIHGSDFVGAYVIATDRYVFCYRSIEMRMKEMLSQTLSQNP